MVEFCCRLSSQQVRFHFCQERSPELQAGYTGNTNMEDARTVSGYCMERMLAYIAQRHDDKSCTQRTLLVWCVCGAYAACGKAG